MCDTIFPRDITDELLVLLKNIMEGRSGSHIDKAMTELDDAIKIEDVNPMWLTGIRLLRARAVEVISRSRSHAPSSLQSSKSANKMSKIQKFDYPIDELYGDISTYTQTYR